MNKADAMAWQGRRLDIRNSNPSLPAGICRKRKMAETGFAVCHGNFGGDAHEMCLCDGWNPRGY